MKWRVVGTKVYNKSATCFSLLAKAVSFATSETDAFTSTFTVLVVPNATDLYPVVCNLGCKGTPPPHSTWSLFNK